jgi:apoptosis-stimulating of p53 protein 1
MHNLFYNIKKNINTFYLNSSFYCLGVQEKLGIMNNGQVFPVFDYDAQHNDELSLKNGDSLVILRKGDDNEREWWWSKLGHREGYVPRNLLGVSLV